jgi:hypothetical protein
MKVKLTILLLILISALISLPIAYAASPQYYAKTTIYFNVPTDATFSVGLPSTYSLTAITGTDETGATSVSWISFNFTAAPQSALQQPYAVGVSADAQAGSAKPIFLIKNTGNTNETFLIRADATLPTGMYLYGNATCATGCSGPTTALTAISTSYVSMVSSLYTNNYLNLTLYANTTSSATAGQTSVGLYINSTAVA